MSVLDVPIASQTVQLIGRHVVNLGYQLVLYKYHCCYSVLELSVSQLPNMVLL